MLYYIKQNFVVKIVKFSFRHAIKLIFFLNKLIIDVEFRYWFIELKIIDIVWMFKKTRHIMKIFNNFIIIYIDHDVVLKIIFQIIFFITSIDKLNFRLIKTFDYIQRFTLNIKHKSKKQHIIFDVLFWFVNENINSSHEWQIDENKLNLLFIAILMKMKFNFKWRILNDYKNDLNWQRIFVILNSNANNDENVAKLFFYKKKMISFFIRMILQLKIMHTNLVDFVFHIWLFKTFYNWFMTKSITSIMSNATSTYHRFDTFVISRDIYEIIWNIVHNVWFIKFDDTSFTNHFNQFCQRHRNESASAR